MRQLSLAVWPRNSYTLEYMLQRYLTAIMLAQQSSSDRSLLLSCGVPSDVVRDREEDQRMELDTESGIRRFLRNERFRLIRHNVVSCPKPI